MDDGRRPHESVSFLLPGAPDPAITTHDAAGGQLYHEAHRLSVEDLRERGMVEEVTTAMERRRQAHGRA